MSADRPLLPRIVRTCMWPKPIPLRQFDWSATAEDYEPGDPVGYGKTEAEAVNDLFEQYMEKEAGSL